MSEESQSLETATTFFSPLQLRSCKRCLPQLPIKQSMREYHGEERPCCYFHPMQVTVGVCSLCLKERLQVLASKKGRHLLLPRTGATATERSLRRLDRNYSSINIHKVFSLGSTFLHLSHKNKDVHSHDQSSSISSLEDSFISIKFENDHASWQTKKTINATPSTSITCGIGIAMAKDSKGVTRRRGAGGVVEHTKKHDDGALLWRKRIGRLLQLARWRKSNKASSGPVAFGNKRGWIRGTARGRTSTTDWEEGKKQGKIGMELAS